MRNDSDNPIVVKSFAFAVRIVNLYKSLTADRKEYVISKQLLRSGTSIGANVKEAVRGQSKLDFHAKMCIALKECSESEYWLELLSATSIISESEASSMLTDCLELLRILMSITKSSKPK